MSETNTSELIKEIEEHIKEIYKKTSLLSYESISIAEQLKDKADKEITKLDRTISKRHSAFNKFKRGIIEFDLDDIKEYNILNYLYYQIINEKIKPEIFAFDVKRHYNYNDYKKEIAELFNNIKITNALSKNDIYINMPPEVFAEINKVKIFFEKPQTNSFFITDYSEETKHKFDFINENDYWLSFKNIVFYLKEVPYYEEKKEKRTFIIGQSEKLPGIKNFQFETVSLKNYPEVKFSDKSFKITDTYIIENSVITEDSELLFTPSNKSDKTFISFKKCNIEKPLKLTFKTSDEYHSFMFFHIESSTLKSFELVDPDNKLTLNNISLLYSYFKSLSLPFAYIQNVMGNSYGHFDSNKIDNLNINLSSDKLFFTLKNNNLNIEKIITFLSERNKINGYTLNITDNMNILSFLENTVNENMIETLRKINRKRNFSFYIKLPDSLKNTEIFINLLFKTSKKTIINKELLNETLKEFQSVFNLSKEEFILNSTKILEIINSYFSDRIDINKENKKIKRKTPSV